VKPSVAILENAAATTPAQLQRQLLLDFNSRDDEDRLRIGPVAAERLEADLNGASAGEVVLIKDSDGNRCRGILLQLDSGEWAVQPDWSTWEDADDATA
jgi:hypothetical protein